MKKFLWFAAVPAILLSSCTRELAEPEAAAPQMKGTSTIIASMASGAETRTHIENGGFYWDKGDAMGVFNANANNKVSVQFGYTGENNEFSGDMDFFVAEEYYAYYPFAFGTKLEEESVTIPIQEEQLYNYQREDKEAMQGVTGSFATGYAPSVGYGTANEKNQLYLPFHPVASYLIVPIKGIGTVYSLGIKAVSSDIALAGDLKVDLSVLKTLKEEDYYPNDKVEVFNGKQTITLECGKGVDLDSETPINFWFVVAPGQEIKDAEFEIVVNDNVTIPVTYTNSSATAPTNTGRARRFAPIEWISGGEESFLIRTASDFVEYAYAATKGVGAVTALLDGEKHDMINYVEDGTNTLKPAMIVKPINLKDVPVSNNHDEYEGDDAKYSKFENEVYFKWFTPNKVLETIGGGATYKIVGNVDGKPAEISGIEVKGNGIFKSNFGQYSTVSDIILKGAKVDAGEAEKAYFVADNIWNFGASGEWGKGINVTVDGGELIAKTGVKKAWFGTVQSPLLAMEPVKVAEGSTAPEVDYYAHSLAVYADNTYTEKEVTLGEEYFIYTKDENGKDIATVHFGEIYANKGQAMFVNVKDRPAALAVINAINMDDTVENGWFSVVTRKDKKVDTSYWTGFIAPTHYNTTGAAHNDGIFTAEEFVFAAKNGSNSTVISMTNNIDLNYKAIDMTHSNDNQSFYIDGTDAKYAIMRATVTNGLVGGKTDTKFTNVEIGPTFIDVKGTDATPYLLAKSGIAQNVKANVLTYRYDNDATAKDGVVAGLFYEGEINDLTKTTGCEVKAASGFGDDNFAAIYAYVSVPLGYNYIVPAFTLNGYQPFVAFNCYANGEKLKQQNSNITFKGTFAKELNAETLIRWDTEKSTNLNDEIAAGTKVELLFNGKSKSDNYKEYKGELYDPQSILKALESGKDVTLGTDITIGKTADGKDQTLNLNGNVLDGNGKTITNTTTSYGITGPGEVKNVTTNGGFRAVGGNGISGTLKLTDCVFGEGSGYALHATGANADVVVTRCEFQGWVSWAVNSISFTECTFSEGHYFDYSTNEAAKKDHWNSPLAPSSEVTFTKCVFGAEMYWTLIDRLPEGKKVYLKGCKTDNGELITKTNFETLFKDHIILNEGKKVEDYFVITAE